MREEGDYMGGSGHSKSSNVSVGSSNDSINNSYNRSRSNPSQHHHSKARRRGSNHNHKKSSSYEEDDNNTLGTKSKKKYHQQHSQHQQQYIKKKQSSFHAYDDDNNTLGTSKKKSDKKSSRDKRDGRDGGGYHGGSATSPETNTMKTSSISSSSTGSRRRHKERERIRSNTDGDEYGRGDRISPIMESDRGGFMDDDHPPPPHYQYNTRSTKPQNQFQDVNFDPPPVMQQHMGMGGGPPPIPPNGYPNDGQFGQQAPFSQHPSQFNQSFPPPLHHAQHPQQFQQHHPPPHGQPPPPFGQPPPPFGPQIPPHQQQMPPQMQPQNPQQRFAVLHACDEKTGKCLFHPHITLRKKAILGVMGGWKDVLRACPECEAEDLMRLNSATSNGSGGNPPPTTGLQPPGMAPPGMNPPIPPGIPPVVSGVSGRNPSPNEFRRNTSREDLTSSSGNIHPASRGRQHQMPPLTKSQSKTRSRTLSPIDKSRNRLVRLGGGGGSGGGGSNGERNTVGAVGNAMGNMAGTIAGNMLRGRRKNRRSEEEQEESSSSESSEGSDSEEESDEDSSSGSSSSEEVRPIDRSDRSGPMDRSDRSNRAERVDRGERLDRLERSDRGGDRLGDRVDRGGDRGDRGDRRNRFNARGHSGSLRNSFNKNNGDDYFRDSKDNLFNQSSGNPGNTSTNAVGPSIRNAGSKLKKTWSNVIGNKEESDDFISSYISGGVPSSRPGGSSSGGKQHPQHSNQSHNQQFSQHSQNPSPHKHPQMKQIKRGVSGLIKKGKKRLSKASAMRSRSFGDNEYSDSEDEDDYYSDASGSERILYDVDDEDDDDDDEALAQRSKQLQPPEEKMSYGRRGSEKIHQHRAPHEPQHHQRRHNDPPHISSFDSDGIRVRAVDETTTNDGLGARSSSEEMTDLPSVRAGSEPHLNMTKKRPKQTRKSSLDSLLSTGSPEIHPRASAPAGLNHAGYQSHSFNEHHKSEEHWKSDTHEVEMQDFLKHQLEQHNQNQQQQQQKRWEEEKQKYYEKRLKEEQEERERREQWFKEHHSQETSSPPKPRESREEEKFANQNGNDISSAHAAVKREEIKSPQVPHTREDLEYLREDPIKESAYSPTYDHLKSQTSVLEEITPPHPHLKEGSFSKLESSRPIVRAEDLIFKLQEEYNGLSLGNLTLAPPSPKQERPATDEMLPKVNENYETVPVDTNRNEGKEDKELKTHYKRTSSRESAASGTSQLDKEKETATAATESESVSISETVDSIKLVRKNSDQKTQEEATKKQDMKPKFAFGGLNIDFSALQATTRPTKKENNSSSDGGTKISQVSDKEKSEEQPKDDKPESPEDDEIKIDRAALQPKPKRVKKKEDNVKTFDVTNLPWTGRFGESGMYTGVVNEQYQPHGKGIMSYDNGDLMNGHWRDGEFVRESGEYSDSEDDDDDDDDGDGDLSSSMADLRTGFTLKYGRDRSRSRSRSQSRDRARSKSRDRPMPTPAPAPAPAPTPSPSPEPLPSYEIGDPGKHRDMIMDKEEALEMIPHLKVNEGAFIRRSDGKWTYAVVKTIEESAEAGPTIRFTVNKKNSSKAYVKKYWQTHIRPMKKPEKKEKAEDPDSSSVCSAADREGRSKQRDPAGTVSRQDSFISVNSTESEKEVDRGTSCPPTQSRISFEWKARSARSRSRSRRRAVSFSPRRQLCSISESDREDEEEEDEPEASHKASMDAEFALDTITGRGYTLRGIDP